MKKLVLGVVALCVAMSSAQAVCDWEANKYEKCAKDYAKSGGDCRTERDVLAAKARLEACLAKERY